MRSLTRVAAALAATFLVLAPGAAAAAAPPQTDRAERDLSVPDGKGKAPTYRKHGTTLLVCGTAKTDIDNRVASYPTDLRVATLSLWTQCQTGGFRTLQDAVANVKLPDTNIKILPGVYLDAPATSSSP